MQTVVGRGGGGNGAGNGRGQPQGVVWVWTCDSVMKTLKYPQETSQLKESS